MSKPDRRASRPSALLDTRIIYCGDCLDQLRKLPDACVDLITIDPPFNSNRNYEVFWGESKEKRSFDHRLAHDHVTGIIYHQHSTREADLDPDRWIDDRHQLSMSNPPTSERTTYARA